MKLPFRSRSSGDDAYGDDADDDDGYGEDDPYGDDQYSHAPRLADRMADPRNAPPPGRDPRGGGPRSRDPRGAAPRRARDGESRRGGPRPGRRAPRDDRYGASYARSGQTASPPAPPPLVDTGRHRLGVRPPTDAGQHDAASPSVPAPRHRAKILPSTGNLPPLPDVEETFLDESERIRTEATAEQRTAWAYLALLGGLFCIIVLSGYAFSDQRDTVLSGGQTDEESAVGEPSHLVLEVNGELITLDGTVPDEAARAQLLAVAQVQYGVENVIDNLQVDPAMSLDGGTIRVSGSAPFGDERPETLLNTISADFGLENRGFEVNFVDSTLVPVDAEVAVTGDQVALTGALPDEQSVTDLVAVVTEIWGAENVDATALTVGSTTWTDGRLRVTGSALPTDQQVLDLAALVQQRLGTLVTVDVSALSTVDPAEQLADVQTRVSELVEANSIQFAPDSPDIEPESDGTLEEVAAILNEATAPVEVVGHTDSVGPDTDNQVLSEERAAAVVDRLTELGVDAERLTSRGEGEANPIADNTTDEGKAANRRIEFLVG